MSLPLTAALPQNGSIVSRWKLGEASGNRADSVGSNALTNENSVGTTTGQFSANASTFNGTNQYLNIASASLSGLAFTGNFTLSTWIYFNAAGAYFMGKYNAGGGNRSYLFGYGTDGGSGGNGLFLYMVTSGGSLIVVNNNTTLTLSGWHLVSVSYSTAGTAAFYVDGVQAGTTQSGLPTAPVTGVSDFNLAAFESGGTPAGFLNGNMQDAIAWSVTLSSTDQTNLYNAYFPSAAVVSRLSMLGVG